MSDQTPTPAAEPSTEKAPISEARLAANRENAQKSHGPVTPEGKAKTRLNAIKSNLTGAHMMFADNDEHFRYVGHIDSYQKEFQPVGPEEQELVQSIADIRWRLRRIPALEQAILATGGATACKDNPALSEPGMETVLELTVRRMYEKELRNLALTENRLARRCERELDRLERRQTTRKENEEQALAEAAKVRLLASHRQEKIYDLPGLGFVFSLDRFLSYMRKLTTAQRQKFLQEALAEAANDSKTMEAAA